MADTIVGTKSNVSLNSPVTANFSDRRALKPTSSKKQVKTKNYEKIPKSKTGLHGLIRKLW